MHQPSHSGKDFMHSVGVTLFSMIFRKLLALDMQLILYQLTYSAYLYTTHNYHAVCILKWFWTLSLSCVWVQNAMVRGWTHVHVYTHAHGTVGIRLVTYHTWGENTLISNVTGLLKWTHGYIVDDTTANICATILLDTHGLLLGNLSLMLSCDVHSQHCTHDVQKFYNNCYDTPDLHSLFQ